MNKHVSRHLGLWAPVVLFAGAIFAASAMPDPHLIGPTRWKDKIGHLIGYTPFGFLLMRAFCGSWSHTRRSCASSFALGALYGASDEMHQAYVPGRSCDFMDWIANLVGLALGIGIFLIGNGGSRETPER